MTEEFNLGHQACKEKNFKWTQLGLITTGSNWPGHTIDTSYYWWNKLYDRKIRALKSLGHSGQSLRWDIKLMRWSYSVIDRHSFSRYLIGREGHLAGTIFKSCLRMAYFLKIKLTKKKAAKPLKILFSVQILDPFSLPIFQQNLQRIFYDI